MLKKSLRCKVVLALLVGIPLFSSSVFATGNNYERGNGGDDRQDHRGDSRRDDRQDHRGDNGGDRHYYRDGRWYKHDSRGQEVSVADLFIGAIAEALPPQHTTVIIQNNPYYYDNSHYYKQLPNGGFVVVEPPRR